MKAALAVGLAFALLAGMFAGLSSSAKAQVLSGAYGGDLKVALQDFGGTDPPLDPTAPLIASDRTVLELLYDSLGRIDPTTLAMKPWAATGWTYDTVNKTMTVTLRTDLKFSNGESYNANDVRYSLLQYRTGGVNRWAITVVDTYTLRLNFTTVTVGEAGPGLFFTEGLSAFIAWNGLGARRYSGPFSAQPPTSGQLVLAANLYHFSGRPYLDTVTYKWPYRLDYAANGTTRSNDAACALMFREVNLIGWPLLANDLTNARDCVARFGGFPPLDVTDSLFDLETVNITGAQVSSVVVSISCRRVGSQDVDVRTLISTHGEAYAGASAFDCPNSATYGMTSTTYTTNPFTGANWTQDEVNETQAGCRDNDRTFWEVRCSGVRVDVNFVQPGPPPATLLPDGNGDMNGWVVSGTAGCTDETNEWTCVNDDPSDGDTTYILSKEGTKKSILNPAPEFSMPFVRTATNPGDDFLYFGFTFGASSFFTGPPGTSGQKLRSALSLIVNKGLYGAIEKNTVITQSVINRFNSPWAPVDCAPWSPCVPSIEANTISGPVTDTGPSAIALDQGGLLDRNADGIRETPSGVPLAFRLIAPSSDLDALKWAIANNMQIQLNSVGLSVTVDTYDTWAALDSAIGACTTGCMYFKRFTTATQLPDWLYTMPEVRAANDPAVNFHLDLGANATTVEDRQLHVGHVQHLIAVAADVVPVLVYDALEAYDFETFSGWVNTFGGINNFWSMTGLRLPSLGDLTATVSIFPTVRLTPGANATVQVQVLDTNGNAVPGATVALQADLGTVEAPTGTTDGFGAFSTNYTAPLGVSTTLDATITATVTKSQYEGVVAWGSLSVHPEALEGLTVTLSRPSAEIDSGATTTLTVQVLDEDGLPEPGATVVLTADLPGATFTPSSGTTNAGGSFTSTFRADLRQGVQYRITASVSQAGYASADASTSLSVKSSLGNPTPVERTRNVPGFEAAYAIVAVATVFALVALVRRRREG